MRNGHPMKTILEELHVTVMSSFTVFMIILLGIVSCGTIYDDQPECPTGARLRFIYDYNMEYANAFMRNVDCLTVYFYDESGRYITTRNVTGEPLADENYRMTVDLPVGKYHIVAYGGIACGKTSFAHPQGMPVSGSYYTDLTMAINPASLVGKPDGPIHNLFWGAADFTVVDSLGEYTEATIGMIKDTNNVRVMLQHLNGKPVNPDDFKWEIMADNTLMAYDNSLVPNGEVTYNPWETGTVTAGYMNDGTPITNAYAELSIARLVIGDTNSPVLSVTHVKDGRTTLRIPLVKYLMLLRSDLFSNMQPQEFLDRESHWTLLFLLNRDDVWSETEICVNDWVVRINDIRQ